MKSELQTAQDIPIELHPFSVTSYGDRYVVKNHSAKTFIFIDDEERGLLEALSAPASMASLIQLYQLRSGKYSYKKVFEFIALLLSASFLTPKSQAALTAAELFRPFAPPPPPRIVVPLVFSAPEMIGRPLAKFMDSRLAIGILSILTGFCAFEMLAREGEFEWLSIGGRYTTGLAMWVISLAAIFFLKKVFKSLLLTGRKLDTSGSGIRVAWGIPIYVVKDSDILTQGPDCTLRFHLAALLFPSILCIPSLILFRQTHAGFLGIWSLACLLAIFLDLSPFVRREFLNALDRLSGKNRMLETLKNFVDRKFVGRIFSSGTTFGLEARLIGYGIYLYSVLWMYVAYFVVRKALERNMGRLTDMMISMDSTVGRAAAMIFAVGILLPSFGLVAGVVRLIGFNLYTIFEKPLNVILNGLSHIVHRFRVMPKSEIAEFLKDIPLFAHMTPVVRAKLAEYMDVEYFRPGRTVVWQGKPGDAFYTIYEGSADVFREGSRGCRTLLASLSARDSFGEIALIKDEPRTATVKARSALICLVLRKQFFKKFVETCLEDKDQITKLIQWNALLKGLPMFVDLPAETMARVILEMSERHVAKGETVIREGDAASEFYILRSGAAEVWKDHGKPASRKIATLGPPGAYFGEIALFEDSPRTATVVAQEPSEILVMPKEAFFRILRTSIFSGMWVEETSRVRRAEMSARS